MLDLPLSFLYQPAAARSPSPWLLVLLHGVGSNEEDMAGLAPHVPDNFHVLSLRGPNTLGPHMYAWFEFAITPQGRVIDRAQEAASRALLAQTVPMAAAQLGVPPERVIMGGFSQGGIMSLSLLLTQPALMQGALVMHSRLLAEVLPLAAPAAQLQGKVLWVSHGTADSMIPLANARAIRDHVASLPLTLTYSEFPGAHEIRPAELQAVMGWLADISQAN